MSNHIYIDGFGLAGFRSFGDEVQRIAPCQKINLLVGQNNSGKSNILLFLSQFYTKVLEIGKDTIKSKNYQSNIDFNVEFLDYYVKNNHHQSNEIIYEIGISEKRVDIFFDDAHEDIKKAFEVLLISKALSKKTENIWFPFVKNDKRSKNLLLDNNLYFKDLVKEIEGLLNKHDFLTQEIWLNMYNFLRQKIDEIIQEDKEKREILTRYQYSNSNLWQSISPVWGLLSTIILLSCPIPLITLIPAIRKIGEAGSEFQDDDFSGQGIIKELHKLQSPDWGNEYNSNKNKFQMINQFLKTLTDNQTATLEIPSTESQILVNIDDKTLPLTNLGTGIHQVIMFATWATILENQVLCIEEPELHLHPILQKKLIRYLQEKTTNQYFITTHSAHFLDTPEVAIFHITLENGQSKIECVSSNSKKYQICADLGYRPSDLLQANCIIWVEGPSDRIYLNHWLKLVDPNLVEGIHYSIMFYGGKLLSHLSASDTDENDSDIDNNEQVEVEEFISLSSLNHNIAMIIDSDKENENSEINKTKQRLAADLNNNNNFVWITEGREIENYINPEILEDAIAAIHPQWKTTYTRKADKYNNSLILVPNDSQKKPKTVNKVKVAKSVVETQTKEDLSRLDLQDRLNELVDFINKANGIQPH